MISLGLLQILSLVSAVGIFLSFTFPFNIWAKIFNNCTLELMEEEELCASGYGLMDAA